MSCTSSLEGTSQCHCCQEQITKELNHKTEEIQKLNLLVSALQQKLDQHLQSNSVDLKCIQGSTSWTDAFHCDICKDGTYSMSFQLDYIPYGKKEVEIINSACSKCTRELMERDPELATQEYWNKNKEFFDQLYEYGVLSRQWLIQRGIDIEQMNEKKE